ncbi:hypothetical protein HanXRQr2_Chr05g0237631 [Helianthus annuus]|uniref:Uncharacterized protein n=1 Tax=Helianthus annuus TaxID=4232 RepID=A0A9K3J3R8_HELAN|nr:hypothetical protein HanXRQr2_Chr05g0237631 [Helianthus annuus]KAJ0924535.1 hypothetical protein HanPSC8_Chr05g0229231 [Helianthus annuus]
MVPAVFSHGHSAFLFGFLRSLGSIYMLFGWVFGWGDSQTISNPFLFFFFLCFYK